MTRTQTTLFRTVLTLSALCAGAVHAQDTRAKVQGVVKDATQAVVIGAQVTLRNNDTGAQATENTTTVGQYLFDFVLPGTYTVTVETPGFRKFVQKNVLVQSRGDVTVNATIEVGSVGESITIDASLKTPLMSSASCDQITRVH